MSKVAAPVFRIHSERDLDDEQRPVASDRADYTVQRCWHDRVRLDNAAHRAYCRECDAEVDPFEVLRKMAHDSEALIGRREQAHDRARAAEARLENILREERNAKARLRSARRAEKRA